MPSPGVSYTNVQACLDQIRTSGNGVFALLNLFSGGALLQLSVFALGIMPYITASIILQLLTVVIPRLETLRQEGQSGQAKITQYTRYLTLGLARPAGLGVRGAGPHRCAVRQHLQRSRSSRRPRASRCALTLTVLVITMTAGTGVVMWLGEMVTDRGVGNGMSVLIFTSIAARLPAEGWQIKAAHRLGHLRRSSWSSASSSSPRSSSSSRRSAGSRCSTPSAWSAGACTAARRPTSR